MKQLLLAAALLAAPLWSSGAASAPMTMQYGLYMGGLPLATLDVEAVVEPERYETRASFRARGWLQPFIRANGAVTASGVVSGGVPRPQSFDYDLQGREPRRTRMVFDESGAPVTVTADPPFEPKAYQLDIADVGVAFDPASAVAMLTVPRADACRLDFKVFDGRKLHRIALSSGGEARPGVALCSGRYERVAGFKAKMMTPERRAYDFQAEIEQLPDGRYRPLRVWADTPLGRAIAVLNAP